jgi:diguanylate cyclase (GGDEF)-like protein/PAS domain S-box-containing protein
VVAEKHDAPTARERRPDGVPELPSAEVLAEAWAMAVSGTGVVPGEQCRLVRFLHDLAADLLAAMTARQFDCSVPVRVGAALVDAHFTETFSIERTLGLLGRELAPAACRWGGADRLAALQGGIASGYAMALQARTRREQERVSAAARAAAEEARWDSDARFRSVFAEAVIGIGLADTEGRILDLNDAMAEILGHPRAALQGGTIWSFVHPDDVPGVWDRTKELLAGERNHLRMEKAYFRPDGSEVWTDLVLSLVRDPDGIPQYMVAMMADITEQHRLQTRLQHQALHDPLTDLPNRTVFFERLDAALDAGVHAGICYLDLDGFKAVNDTLGHDRGDALLRAIAQQLTDALGREHLVARMGGDEFVVLVERDADNELMRHVARTALEAVRRPVLLDGNVLGISASVGVVHADGGRDAAELMKAADTTLYWAKGDGRNRYAAFDEQRHRRDVGRFELSARMPEALARGEFSLEYQPLVRLADRRMTGVEALVRWTLPDGRRVDPTAFVGLAEETGFIVTLGRWVLTQACRQAAAWVAADPAARLLISVNLAARQVREPRVVDDIAAILDETGWPAELLQLELTESALMGTPEGPLTALQSLAAMGVRIAIDDFGTGYSNLAYLRHLPVHGLKLAGPFVTGVGGGHGAGPTQDVDREVVGLLIRMAHTLGLTVTAESVETAAQYAHLRRLGCATGQGWLFAPAMAAEEIPPLVGRTL